MSALETSVHDPSVAAYLQEATKSADDLKAKLQQVANHRVEIEKRTEASC